MAPLNPGEVILTSPDPSSAVDEIDLGTIAASALAYGRGAHLHGWSILESTGAAPAKVRIHDGQGAGGAVLARIGLGNGGNSNVLASELGIRAVSGLFVEVAAGSVEVSLYVRTLDAELG